MKKILNTFTNEFSLMRRGILAKTMVYLAGMIVANINK